jgi:glycosyltransferase involved in cell wall biosynthesis
MSISIITPTADRPLAFALCERWIARQSIPFDEWIVADGGHTPARCTMGQTHIVDQRPPGAANFANNLLNGIAHAKGDVCLIIEDDDWLAPTHIESIVAALDRPYALIAGPDRQHYYHVGARVHRTMSNPRHASLCQTGIRRGAMPLIETIVKRCLADGKFSIDFELWLAISTAQQQRTSADTCVGIKGLPGQAGLGIGHRPAGLQWKADPHLEQLRAWVGEDAETTYANFCISKASSARLAPV